MRKQTRNCLSRAILRQELGCMFLRKECFPEFKWTEFFKLSCTNYWGEEVKVSQWFKWENIAPALPDQCIGAVDALEVCAGGIKHFIENPELYLNAATSLPAGEPKVMVRTEDWAAVAKGLLDKGVCGVIAEDEVHTVGNRKVFGGLFGVSKDEWHGDVETFRLIMNLVPLNSPFVGLSGDLSTLPAVSQFLSVQLGQDEILLMSSEDKVYVLHHKSSGQMVEVLGLFS